MFIVYYINCIPSAPETYSITECELLCLVIESTSEPPTTRVKRLLEVRSAHTCNLHYIKGDDVNTQ